MKNSSLSSSQPLSCLNSNTRKSSRHMRHHNRSSPLAISIIDSHIVHLHAQLANLNQQYSTTSTIDSTRLKSLIDSYEYNCLQLKARFKTEEERINRRFEAETRSTRTQFSARKTELKEALLDRLRRKRKLVVDEMRSAIDINSRSFDADPLLLTMQPPHPLQAKAYNFRQRPDMAQQNSSTNYSGEEDFSSLFNNNNALGTAGILSPIPTQQAARKRLVGAFSIFQLPRWTVRDDECEDDLRLITTSRK